MNNPLSKPLMLAAFVAAALACTPAFAAKKSKIADDDMSGLLEMSDQLDKVDKEDFQAAIDRANDCTRARNFSCSESELAKAGKLANGAKDKKVLAAARQSIVDEKALIAEEERRREKERQLAEERARERERQARREAEEREERQSARNSSAEDYAAIMGGFNSNLETLANINRQTNERVREINRVQTERAAAEAHIRAEQEERRREERREARRMEEARQSRERLAQADARDRTEQRRVEAERAAEQQRREREAQQREEQRRKDEQAQRERAQEQERQRQREREREQAERVAKAQAEKAAAQQAEAAYMSAMRQGIRLAATKCPDGAGHYYVTGKAPNVKGSYCIDVYYQAVCPGSRVRINGMAHNFVGMSGCFGDTYQIDPKPACPVDQVSIEVTDVRQCN
jgi:hypothetical protein